MGNLNLSENNTTPMGAQFNQAVLQPYQQSTTLCSFSVGGDVHVLPGQTDDYGDEKRIGAVCVQDDGLTYGATGSLYTNPLDEAGKQYDTGRFGFLVGDQNIEITHNLSASVIAKMGGLNGKINDQWYQAVDGAHDQLGFDNPSRKSAASTSGSYYANIRGMVTHETQLAEIGEYALLARGSTYATLGTDERSVGAAAYMAIRSQDTVVTQPYLKGDAYVATPGLAVGYSQTYYDFDVTRGHESGSYTQGMTYVQAGFNIMDKLTVGASIEKPLDDEIPKYMTAFTVKF